MKTPRLVRGVFFRLEKSTYPCVSWLASDNVGTANIHAD